MKPFKKDQ